MNSDLRPRPVLNWFCVRCGEAAWGCAEQRDYWQTIHVCKGDGMTTIQEKIEAAKAKIEKEKERLADLEKAAAEPPKRQSHRSPKQVQEIMLLEVELRKRFGVGFPGLAEIARRAKKEGTVLPPAPPVAEVQNPRPGPPTAEGVATTIVTGTVDDNAFPPEPREHHGDGDEPLAVQPDPIWDPSDEPPIENTPELAAAQAADDEDDMPW